MNLTVKLTPVQLQELKEDIAQEMRLEHNVSAQDDIQIEEDVNNRERCNLTIPVCSINLRGLGALSEAYDPALDPEVVTIGDRTFVRLYSIPQSNLPIYLKVV